MPGLPALLRRLARLCLPALATLLLDGCASASADAAPADPARPHHTASGFRNTAMGPIDKPLSDLLRWKWQS